MIVIRKKPKHPPEEISIPNTLKALQAEVGGYIESHRVTEDMAIICNEEGRLTSKEPNCRFLGIDWVGTILLVGIKNGDYTDCPLRQSVMEWLHDE